MTLSEVLKRQQREDKLALDTLLDCRPDEFTQAKEAESARLIEAIAQRKVEIKQAEAAEERQAASCRAAVEHGDVNRPAERAGGGWHTRERETYNAERDRVGERSFFSDLYNAEVRGDVQARQRFQQYQAESRSTTTSTYGGLVVPQYLVEQAALVARASRPFANTVTHLALPDQGMVLDIPKGTTGVAVASQATQNTNVQSTDQVWTDLTPGVVTIAGQQDVSRQSLERGTPGLDMLVMQDLAAAYFAELDRQVVNGSGASGQLLGVLGTSGITAATAYGAALTFAKFQSRIAGASVAVLTNRLLAASHIAVAPRRWGWMLAQADAQGRPMIVPSQSERVNAFGEGDLNPNMVGDTGYDFGGLRVVVDPNIPTNVGTLNEDVAIVYRAADLLLFEDGDGAPRNLRFEQTLGGQLTIKIVAYGYSSFTAGRYPTAVALTGGADSTAGNGQIAPTF